MLFAGAELVLQWKMIHFVSLETKSQIILQRLKGTSYNLICPRALKAKKTHKTIYENELLRINLWKMILYIICWLLYGFPTKSTQSQDYIVISYVLNTS